MLIMETSPRSRPQFLPDPRFGLPDHGGTELVPTRNRDDATISMESGQEPPPGSLTDVDQRLLEYCPHGPRRRARVGRILFLAGIRDPPDGTRAVVSHKQRAVRRHGHADRTA